ncbi:MAG: thioredoxin family protein [Chitinophagaceae bacterium]|nr:thioredoxin family protein [Oligoflexus sp.]
MTCLIRMLIFACVTAAGPTLSYAAEVLSADHVKVTWIAPNHFTAAEETIGIRFQIDPHWHIYWKNPGDSGTAPKFNFHSDNAALGDVGWPMPKRFLLGGLTTVGYETNAVFPVKIKPVDSAGRVRTTVELEWLVCQEECLPGAGQLTLERPVSTEPQVWPEHELLLNAIARLPSDGSSSPWQIKNVEKEGVDIQFFITTPHGEPVSKLTIFPSSTEVFLPTEPTLSKDGKALVLKLQPGKTLPDYVGLVLSDGKGSWEFPSIATKTQDSTQWSTYLLILLSAFAGGIILNLMPCVLPVLSIKFFSLAKVDSHTRWNEAMLYTLGVLATFTALGGLFLALRAGGTAIGWGFQLQSPSIVTALIILFWLMGLSFLGFFEFGNSLTRAAGKFENVGAFGTGCLSVFIATPCTGPFMGTTLGAASVLPAAQALLIFFCLGLGLALPFLLLAFFPRIRLPRPGMWMITLRQFLAFPLFATVIWLLWVLGSQLGTDAWIYLSSLALILTFCIWLGKGRGAVFKAVAAFASVASFIAVESWVLKAPLATAAVAQESVDTWTDYSAKLIDEAKSRHQAVFVDFTAAWCVTCQVNKKAVLETDFAQDLFRSNHVLLLKGDWTNLDQKITAALAAFGRASVPLYLFYPADGTAPRILPQILSRSDIEGLFTR